MPWNPRGLAVEAQMASSTRRYIAKSLVQQHGETPGCSASLGVSSQHMATCRERFERLIKPNATDVIPVIPSVVGEIQVRPATWSQQGSGRATQPDTLKRQAVGMKRGAEDNPMSSSAKGAHTHERRECITLPLFVSCAHPKRASKFDPDCCSDDDLIAFICASQKVPVAQRGSSFAISPRTILKSTVSPTCASGLSHSLLLRRAHALRPSSRFTNRLSTYAACLTSHGQCSCCRLCSQASPATHTRKFS